MFAFDSQLLNHFFFHQRTLGSVVQEGIHCNGAIVTVQRHRENSEERGLPGEVMVVGNLRSRCLVFFFVLVLGILLRRLRVQKRVVFELASVFLTSLVQLTGPPTVRAETVSAQFVLIYDFPAIVDTLLGELRAILNTMLWVFAD